MQNQQDPFVGQIQNLHQINNEANKQAVNSIHDSSGEFKKIQTKKEGDYVGFIMPPYNEKGLWFKTVGTRFNLPLFSGEEIALLDLEVTFPEARVVDPVAEVVRKYVNLGLTEIDSSWGGQGVSVKVMFNFIPLSTPEKGDVNERIVHIFEQTPATANFLQETMDSKYYTYPIVHPVYGCPLSIKRTNKKKGKSTRVEYTRSILPSQPWFPNLQGDEMISEVNKVMSQMYNFDKIYPFPDNEKMKTYHEVAQCLEKVFSGRLAKMKAGENQHYQGGVPGQATQAIQNMPQQQGQGFQPQQQAPAQNQQAPVQQNVPSYGLLNTAQQETKATEEDKPPVSSSKDLISGEGFNMPAPPVS